MNRNAGRAQDAALRKSAWQCCSILRCRDGSKDLTFLQIGRQVGTNRLTFLPPCPQSESQRVASQKVRMLLHLGEGGKSGAGLQDEDGAVMDH